jgi:hypothetical protein
MPLSDRSPAVVALLAAVVLSIAAPGAGANAAGAAQPQTKALQAATTPARTVAADRQGRTTAATTVVSDGRSAAVTVLLVGLGAVVGVTVGLIPAVLAAMMLGVLPRRPRRRARPEDLLVEPPRAPPAPRAPHPGPIVLAAAPDPPADEPRPRPRPVVARASSSGPPPEIAERRARHRALYDAEYAKQLERLSAQRDAISTDVSVPIEPGPARRANGRRTGAGPSPGSSHD